MVDLAEKRALPGVGPIRPLVLGAMSFERLEPGARRASAAYDAVFDAALEAGIDAIDTAPLYGFGVSERVVGDWRRRRGAKVHVLTKVGLRWDAADGHGEVLFSTTGEDGRPLVVRRDSRPASIALELERSRERLGVERLGLVQVHHRDPHVPIDETMGALVDAWRAGTLEAVGVSNFRGDELELAARAVERLSQGALRLSCTQGLYNLLVRDAERDVLPAVRARSLGFLAFSPLAQGLLTGAMGPDREVRDWRAGTPLFSPANRRTIQAAVERELAPIARRHGVAPSAIALAWLLTREQVTGAIVGARDPAQLRESAAVLSLVGEPRAIDLHELARIGDAFASLSLATTPSLVERVGARVRRLFGR
jgi:aryl-alcohol dehydrogenase-like predicted oxidoreductase